MKNNKLIVLLAVLVMIVLTACGGGNATVGEVVPAANAPTISPQQYLSSVAETDHILVDVRTQEEVAGGVISGAIHIPLAELGQRLDELPADQTIVIYCRSGNRSRQAAQLLQSSNYSKLLDLGGIIQWQQAGQQLVPLGQ